MTTLRKFMRKKEPNKKELELLTKIAEIGKILHDEMSPCGDNPLYPNRFAKFLNDFHYECYDRLHDILDRARAFRIVGDRE